MLEGKVSLGLAHLKTYPKHTTLAVSNVCDALSYLLDNNFIKFGTKLHRQIVGIPMGTNGAPFVADLFLFWNENDFMMPLF